MNDKAFYFLPKTFEFMPISSLSLLCERSAETELRARLKTPNQIMTVVARAMADRSPLGFLPVLVRAGGLGSFDEEAALPRWMQHFWQRE